MHLSWQISQEDSHVGEINASGDGKYERILVSRFSCSHFRCGLSHPKPGLEEETLMCVSVL